MGWLSGWGRRKSLLVEQQADAGANYQVIIKVYKGSGTDGTEPVFGIIAGKVYCGGNCRDDFGDIRITQSDGTTLESHWIMKYSSGSYALIWVKVSGSLSVGDVEIYVYYDKSDATYPHGDDQDEMDATFVFADHFYGDSLDITNKWDLEQGAFEVSDSKLVQTGIASPRGLIYSKSAYGVGKSIISKARWSDANQWGQRWSCLMDKGTQYLEMYGNNVNNEFRFRSPSDYDDVTIPDATQDRIYEIRWISSYGKCLVDGTLYSTVSGQPSADEYVCYYESNIVCGTIYTDYIAIRKFVDPEPIYDTWGEEETEEPTIKPSSSSIAPLMTGMGLC